MTKDRFIALATTAFVALTVTAVLFVNPAIV